MLTVKRLLPDGQKRSLRAGAEEMKKRYGFIYVDKDNDGNGSLERLKKDSFAWYQHVIATNGAEI